MDSIDCVKKRIEEIIRKSPVAEDPIHSKNTLEWLLWLVPDADEYAIDAADCASEAYSYARKAYYSNTLVEAQYYAKEAMGAADVAQSAAIDAQSVANSAESECY